MDISCSLCPVSYSLYLHSLLPRIRPAHRIQNGGIGWPQIVVDSRGDRRAEARHLEFEQRALLRRQIVAELFVEHQRIFAGQRADFGGQALAQARQAEWLAGGNSLSDWLAHAKQVAGGATVGTDAVGVAVLHAKNRGYVEQYRRDFSVGHSSTSLLYSCLRYVVLVR